LKLFQEWREVGKENDGGGKFNGDTIVRTLANATMNPPNITVI
jgi:hypothetical protein